MDEYIIINKSVLEKRIKELEQQAVSFIPSHEATICYKKLDELKQILSQSTPLISEIEKAFDKAREYRMKNVFKHDIAKDYIKQLTLKI